MLLTYITVQKRGVRHIPPKKMADVPPMLKVFFPLLYYALSITVFAFLLLESHDFNEFNAGTNGKHAKEYANAEYILIVIGFALVVVDFAMTMLIAAMQGRLMSNDLYELNKGSNDTSDTVLTVFRKLGVFGAFWGIFQFICGSHIQIKYYGQVPTADDDIYADLIPFLLPPIFGLLAGVLPSVTDGSYSLVSTTSNYM